MNSFIFKFIENKKAIKTLNFRGNNFILSEENKYLIKQGLERNISLESFHLSDCKIASLRTHVVFLKNVLKNNKTLKKLNLSGIILVQIRMKLYM